MPINPLYTIGEETILLKLFDRIMGENRYIDIFKCISQDENWMQQIYENTDKCVKFTVNYDKNDIIIVELNKILKPMKIKCTVDELSCKEVNKRFKSNKKPMYKWLKIEPAFICRHCEQSKIFDTKEKLRIHREENHHKSFKIPQREDKQLTIIENNNCIYTPQLELIEYSGILAELNKKLNSINLTCSIEKRDCIDEMVAMLRFEPDIRCNICGKICDTEHELKECEKEHERVRKEYIKDTDRIPKPLEEKLQKERDKINKGQDRTR